MFIVFEGIDGCGKTTQLDLLRAAFVQSRIDSIFTREPGGTDFAEAIRSAVISNSVHPTAALLAMFAARHDHVDRVILPNLYRTVVCSRYIDSTYAYQVRGSRVLEELAFELSKNLPHPDLTILLDLPVKEARSRMQGRELDVFESKPEHWHSTVYDIYQSRVTARHFVVDATLQPAEIHNLIVNRLCQFDYFKELIPYDDATSDNKENTQTEN